MRARKPKLPSSVLTKEEVQRVLGHMSGTYLLMAKLLYGSGLRLPLARSVSAGMECLRLRVRDFAQRILFVRDGQGTENLATMLLVGIGTCTRATDRGTIQGETVS
jgi:integrase